MSSARAAVTSAEGDVTKDQKHIDKLEKDITTDFGPSDVFRPLKGACVSGDFGEYNYEVCFFDRVTQLSRKDNGRTSLGTFERIELADDSSRNKAAGVFSAGWEESHVEPLSGMVLKHENGQQCWNGPKRSVAVELYCCAENEIRSVVEAEKCVYRFEVGTPAVCGAEGAEEKVRDEL